MNLDNVRVRWNAALEAKASTPDPRVRSPEIGLGLALRARILRSFAKLGQTAMPSVAAMAEMADIKKSGADQILAYTHKEKPNMTAWTGFATAVLRDLARTTPALADLKAADLAKEPFQGPGAVDEFIGWLQGKGLPPEPKIDLLGGSENWIFQTSDDRDDLTQAVLGFVQDTTIGPDTDGGILRVVKGLGMPDGLRAFASHLIGKVGPHPADAGRPICFLPVARDPMTQAAISSDQLIGRLRAFCERLPDLRLAPSPRTPQDRRADIDFIRRTMSRSPFILILDGWGAASGPMGRLDAVVDDDGLVELVTSLQYPARGPDVTVLDARRFWSNRILVLAESEALPLTTAIRQEATFELTPPTGEGLRAVIKQSRAATMPDADPQETPAPAATPAKTPQASPPAGATPAPLGDAGAAPPEATRDGYQRREDLLAITATAAAEITTDTALALLDDLLVRRYGKTEAPADQLEVLAAVSFSTLVDLWFEVLRRDRISFMAVVVLALTRDNTRQATLATFLTRWQVAAMADADALGPEIESLRTQPGAEAAARRLECERAADWCLHEIPPEGAASAIDIGLGLPAALTALRLSGLIIVGQDTPLSGWDDIGGTPQAAKLAYVSLYSEQLRTAVVARITRSEPDELVARLHRLIADEALTQYSKISRNGASNEVVDVRYFRRLIQGIFHGYASLALGPAAVDPGLGRLEARVLPTIPQEAYRRLYSVFYRGLMERPPSWELSRLMGREDLKLDLLLLSETAGRAGDNPWEGLYPSDKPRAFPVEGDDAHPFLSDAAAADLRVRFDQCLAVARAAYHSDQVEIATHAVALAQAVMVRMLGLDKDDGKPWPEWLFREAIDLTKVKCDLDICCSKAGPGEIMSELVRLQFDPKLADKLDAPEGRTLESLDTEIEAFATAVVEHARRRVKVGHAKPPSLAEEGAAANTLSVLLSAWSDMLSRFGEAIAQATFATPQTRQRVKSLRTAFVHLRAAEWVRREAFAIAPLSRDHYVNGHSTRVFIRVCLTLFGLLSRETDGDRQDRELLAYSAKRHLEMLTRYLSRYPTEKASLLILEAALLRTCGDDQSPDLVTAEAALDRADTAILATLHRPRVYMRLLIERIEIYHARLKAGFGGHAAELYRVPVELGRELDMSALNKLAAANQDMWKRHHRRLQLDYGALTKVPEPQTVNE